jgi:hypothetical protein
LLNYRSHHDIRVLKESLTKETRFVAVRVGPDDLHFIAVDHLGRPQPLKVVSGPHTRKEIKEIEAMTDGGLEFHKPRRLPYFKDLVMA